MAVNTPTKPHEASRENTWRTFLQKKGGHPELEKIEHVEKFSDFASRIATVDPEEKNAAKLWIDLQTLKQQQQKQEHELEVEEKAQEEERAAQEHEADTHTDHDEHSSHESSSTGNKGEQAVEFLSKFKKPRFLEEDPVLEALIEKRQHAWEKKNKAPDKHASAEEKIAHQEALVDFAYGDLDGTTPSVEALAREDFASEYTEDKKGNKIKKSDKQIQKDKKAIAKYNENAAKVKKKNVFGLGKEKDIKFDEDFQMHHVKANISAEAAARYELLKKRGLKGTNLDQSYKAVLERIQKKQWEDYFKRHPQKAAHFANEDYKNKHKSEKEAFEAFKKHHAAWIEEQKKLKALAQTGAFKEAEQTAQPGQPLPAQDTLVPPAAPTTQASPPAQPVPPVVPPPVQKELTQEEKVEKALADMKARRAREAAQQLQQQQQAVQQPTQTPPPPQKTGIYAPPGSHPKPAIPQPPIPSAPIPTNIPSQGAVRPGASVSYTHTTPRPPTTRGQARPSGKSMPRSFRWRNPSFAKPSGIPSFRRTAPLDRLNSGLSSGANAVQNTLDTVNNIKEFASTAKTLALFANPVTMTIIGIIIFLIIMVIIFFISGSVSLNITANAPAPTPAATTGIPGLTIVLSGPAQVQNSEDIFYTIDATYTGTADVTLSDPLPTNTKYVSATGKYTNDGATIEESKIVSWKLSDNDGGTGTTKTYKFTITLHPTQDDIWVRNKILANAAGGSNAGATDFDTLMRGQGRNTGVLGDENSFVAKIMASGVKDVQDKESYLRQIYEAAVAKNVNPLIIVSDWALENGFATSGTAPIGCDPYGGNFPGFANNLQCSVNTWNNWMKKYEELAQNGVPVNIPSQKGTTCNYDDAFLYAAEMYGPLCHSNDSNEQFHQSFYHWYTIFLGK